MFIFNKMNRADMIIQCVQLTNQIFTNFELIHIMHEPNSYLRQIYSKAISESANTYRHFDFAHHDSRRH